MRLLCLLLVTAAVAVAKKKHHHALHNYAAKKTILQDASKRSKDRIISTSFLLNSSWILG